MARTYYTPEVVQCNTTNNKLRAQYVLLKLDVAVLLVAGAHYTLRSDALALLVACANFTMEVEYFGISSSTGVFHSSLRSQILWRCTVW